MTLALRHFALPAALLAAACASSPPAPRAASDVRRSPAKADAQASVAAGPATAMSPSRAAYVERAERSLLAYEARLIGARVGASRAEIDSGVFSSLGTKLVRAREDLAELRSVNEGGSVWALRRNRLDVTLEELRRGWERVNAE